MPVILAAYPAIIASFSDKFDLIDVVFAEHINALQREVTAIETVLGSFPAGTAASVRERITAIESTVADINSRFTSTHTFPESAVDGLVSDLNTLRGQISGLQSTFAQLNGQVTALQSQKPEVAQVVTVTGQQYIYGLKAFQGLVRLLATQLYSPSSTNHAWEIGVSGGRVIKFDYTGFGAYDGSGPADLELQRDGGEVFFGGGIRAAGMAGLTVDDAGPVAVTETAYTVHTGAPSLTLQVPQSGRVVVGLTAEASVPTGAARMSVRLSGANTLAESDVRSVVVSSPATLTAQRVIYLTGLTPGATTFTVVFRSTLGDTAHFSNITLAVVPGL